MSTFLLLAGVECATAAPVALKPNLQVRLVMKTTNSSGANSLRIAADPRTGQLYYLKANGDLFRVNLQAGSGTSTSTKVYGVADHGISESAQGLAIGPEGTIYVLGNSTTNNGNSTFARIMKGVPNDPGKRVWSLLAKTEAYPRSKTAFDHVCNGLVVSPDNGYLYINSGSRTDHGEVQSINGLFPNTREVGLTAKILRVPTSGSGLVLSNNLAALREQGYVYAEGTRNSFDLAFAPNGDLFGTENGPDRDMSEELNWLRPGLHYGFPWRIGGTDNPQQFANYNPATDRLLDSRFVAVQGGYYHNDPGFPVRPAELAEPVINLGPDADKYRDPADGKVKDSSATGNIMGTFTAHRSPLGLAFDTEGAMDAPYQHHGFVLSWTAGDAIGNSVAGPFADASQDLLDLELTKLGTTNYQARVSRLVSGFANPIDSEIIGNRIYVIEYSGNQGIWEITFPAAPVPTVLSGAQSQADGSFQFTITGASNQNYEISASSNLFDWFVLTNLVSTNRQFQFIDPDAGGALQRFYRTTIP
ncbi:MAG TPA: PQQ-dependent sugar dehydrogenase [Candidatus Limnocylindria bacterium]|nr:PQQ-dependent sugar dehydrogenase [Candidatus Limnocylindria bacterium]